MLVSARTPAPEARAHPSVLSTGDVLGGRFRLDSIAIADGPTTFYSGTILAGRVPVSIEVLSPDADDGARLAFLAEARKVTALAGPRIARVLHVGLGTAGDAYVVRDRLGGRTLESLISAKGALSVQDATDIAIDVCDALAEAHARGLLHGALGPRSVRVSWRDDHPGEVLVVDLGTARATAMLSPGFGPCGRGTPCAPELLAGGALSARADVWAVGVLLHTMLAGASPFEADTPSSLSVAAAADEAPSLAGVPDALADLVEACLARDPSLRPATVYALARGLAPFTARRDEALARIAARAPAPRLDLDDDELAEKTPVSCVSALAAEPEAVAVEPLAAEPEPASEADAPAPTLVVDDPAYAALRSERITAPPPPMALRPDSTLDVSVEVMPSVRDFGETGPQLPSAAASSASALSREVSSASAITDDTEEEGTLTPAPVVVSRSLAPVAMAPRRSPAPAAPRPEPARRSRAKLAGFATIAACVAIGGALGLRYPASSEPSAPAAVAPPLESDPAPGEATALATSPPPALETATPPAVASPPAVSADTAAPIPSPPRTSTAKPRPPANVGAKRSAAPATAAAPAARPTTAAAPSPPPATETKPEAKPRSTEDDLRRFLDDRR
jgi:hypothetical protein